jgi:hypothetical protein
MLRILLDLYHFCNLILPSSICMLLVRPHRKYAIVVNGKVPPNKWDGFIFIEKDLSISCVLAVYCEIEHYHLIKNLIQNP